MSTVLYATGDAMAVQRATDYSFADQAISELSAVGAPTRAFLFPIIVTYQLLMLAFAIGVWTVAQHNRALRASAGFLFAFLALGIVLMFFPMHQRSATMTFSDTMHGVLGIPIMLCLLGAIGCGAAALGKRFRYYSIATMFVIVVFGMATGIISFDMASGTPTPGLGIVERVSLYAADVWVVVLSIALLRRTVGDDRGAH